MHKLNRKLEYSLMALKHMGLKTQGQLTSAKEISESSGAPFDATARVLQQMASQGWLRSEHGAFGGYTITKNLQQVTLLDLLNVVQGPTGIAKCLHKDEACEIQSSCNILSPIHTLNEKMNQFYRSLSVQELLQIERSDA